MTRAVAVALLASLAASCGPDAAGDDGEIVVVRIVVEGPGRVTSVPEGLDCAGPAVCERAFLRSDDVQLTAIADDGAALAGFAGDCRADPGSPFARFDGAPDDPSCTITFVPVARLRVLVEGEGTVEVGAATCGADESCEYAFDVGAVVDLYAQPASGWELLGFSGECTGADPLQSVELHADAECRVVFQPTFSGVVRFPVRVLIIGSGRVWSDPAGIDCDELDVDCEVEFVEGTTFELHAEADPGWEFAAWGYQCEGLGDATPIGGEVWYGIACTATFAEIVPSTLTVAVTGGGAVTSGPAGIDCPAGSCAAAYDPSTTVTLTATATPGHRFARWEGDCVGAAATSCTNTCTDAFDGWCDDGGLGADYSICALGTDCSDCGPRGAVAGPGQAIVSMAADRTCGAVFEPLPQHDVHVDVAGAGSVAGADGAIACGADCDATVYEGATVTLTATPAATARFARWGGDCAGVEPAIEVVVTAATSCTATFVERLDVDVRWSRRAAGAEVVGARAAADGATIAVLARDAAAARVVVIDAVTGRERARSSVLASPVAFAWDAPGGRVVVADEDRLVRLYDVDSGAVLSSMSGHTGDVAAVDVASDGAHVVSVDAIGRAKLWDAATGLVVRTVVHQADAPVHAVAFSPSGDRFATAGADGFVRVWSVSQAAFLREIDAVPDGAAAATSVAWSADAAALAIGRGDGGLRVHDPDDGALLDQGTSTGAVRDVAFVSSSLIAARVDPADLVVLDRGTDAVTATRTIAGLLTVHAASAGAAEADDGGGAGAQEGLVVAATIDGVLPTTAALPAGDDVVPLAWTAGAAAAGYAPAGATIATGGPAAPTRVWTADGALDADVVGPTATALAWRIGGAEFLVGGSDVVAVDATTGATTTRVPAVASTAALAVTPDDALVATARNAYPYDVRVWELSVGDVYRTLTGAGGVVRALATSPDGARVVGAAADGSVHVWLLATQARERALAGHVGGAVGVALDDDTLLSLGRDGVLRRWTFPAGVADGSAALGCTGAALAWRGGDVAVVGCADGTAHVVDAATLEARATFAAHATAVVAVDVAPDGSGDVLTASADETAVWTTSTPAP